MFEMIVNEKKTGIQFLFKDFHTNEQQFVTAFDLDEAERIAKDLSDKIEELKIVKN